MIDCILKFFYSTFLLIWILIGLVLLTVDYCVEFYNSSVSGSLVHLAFYLSLLAYLLERVRSRKTKKPNALLAYTFLAFWIILAAISVV
jgi:membrane protein implicated in regulation of membrane protease activity